MPWGNGALTTGLWLQSGWCNGDGRESLFSWGPQTLPACVYLTQIGPPSCMWLPSGWHFISQIEKLNWEATQLPSFFGGKYCCLDAKLWKWSLKSLSFAIRVQSLSVDPEVESYASFIAQALEKTRGRECVPSWEEIQGLMGRQEILCTVHYPGPGCCQISITSHTTANEVLRQPFPL